MTSKPELDATTLDSTSPPGAKPDRPVLHVVFSAGRVVTDTRIALRGEVLAGRQVAEEGWSLADDTQASRRHAKLTVRGERVTIEDLGSRNGVRHGGERVRSAELSDGDVIRVGSTLAVLRLEDPKQLDVPIAGVVGISPAMREVRLAVRRMAKQEANVLLLGETGTGKEVVARAIHDVSKRSGPLVAVNCAGVQASLFESELFGHVAGAFTGAREPAEGYFRAAADGTLLLDEIGDMPLPLQAKLLRALETKSVVPVGATTPIPHRARVVAATNREPATEIQRGRFRDDLFARLAQLTITLPPLRERREDILPLIRHVSPELPPLSPSLAEALLIHDWPRNVRELVAIVTELSSRSEGAARLELDMVQDRLVAPPAPSSPPANATPAPPAEPPPVTRAQLEVLLRAEAGNVAALARAIGRSRTQTYRLLEQHDLDPATFRPR